MSAVDREGRTIWIVGAHHGDGKRVVVRTDEQLTITRLISRSNMVLLLGISVLLPACVGFDAVGLFSVARLPHGEYGS